MKSIQNSQLGPLLSNLTLFYQSSLLSFVSSVLVSDTLGQQGATVKESHAVPAKEDMKAGANFSELCDPSGCWALCLIFGSKSDMNRVVI